MLGTQRTMKWNSKYWDIVDDFYWVPKYLGLQSIGRKKWTERDDLICIPSERVNRSGPIYTRVGNADENVGDLRRKEEILNHMFDLTFAIAGNSVVQELLVEPLAFEDRGPSFRAFRGHVGGKRLVRQGQRRVTRTGRARGD